MSTNFSPLNHVSLHTKHHTVRIRVTDLEQKELEGNAMRPVDFVLEVEYVNEVVFISDQLFLRDPLSVNLSIVAQIQYWVLSWGLPIYSVGVGLVYSDSTSLSFIGDLSFLDQSFDQVLNGTDLGNKDIKLVLYENEFANLLVNRD